jgi:hypothetical protein
MNMVPKSTHRLALPTVGAELFTYLKNVNDSDSFTASMRIKDALSLAVKIEVNSWFGIPALPELDQSLLRKLTNSLLAAGEAGGNRTLDALREIRFETTPMTQSMSREAASIKLRTFTRDYRSAKGFLENNHKCINSFMKMNRAINDDTIRSLLRMSINNRTDFLDWSHILITYWEKRSTVKSALRGSYLTNYERFTSTFDDDMTNTRFRNLLDDSISNYVQINSQHAQLESDESSIEEERDAVLPNNSSVIVDFHIKEGSIEFEAIFSGYTKFQLSSIRIKLALLLQKRQELALLKLTVSIGTSEHANSIYLRTSSQLNEEQIQSLTRFLESELLVPSSEQ